MVKKINVKIRGRVILFYFTLAFETLIESTFQRTKFGTLGLIWKS